MKFITKEECETLGIGADADLLNEILSRVYNAAIEAAIRKLPEVVSRMVANTTAVQTMTKDFFNRNKDFDTHKEIVAAVIQDVESKNPAWDYNKILNEAEGSIKEKIVATKNIPKLSLDKPTKVNLDGNGVI